MYVVEKENIKTANIVKVASNTNVKIGEESTSESEGNWVLRYYYKTSQNKEPKEILSFTVEGEVKRGKTIAELIEEDSLKVGDYVNYIPDGFGSGKVYPSTSATQEDLGWRVFSIDSTEGTITLISATPTIFSLPKNEVTSEKLNEICSYLYNSSYAVDCRNLSLADNDLYYYIKNTNEISSIVLGDGSEPFYYDEGLYHGDKEGEYWYGSWVVGEDGDVTCIDDGKINDLPSFGRESRRTFYASLRPVVTLSESTVLYKNEDDPIWLIEGMNYSEEWESGNNVPTLTESDTTISYNPSGWTNREVTVSIETQVEGYTLEYSTDGRNWAKYTEPFKVVDNGTVIYVRLINEKSQIGGILTGTVTNIDNTVPKVNSFEAIGNVNSISLSTDVEDTDSGIGKIIWYYKLEDEEAYKKIEEVYSEMNGKTGDKQAIKTKEITELTAGKIYNMYAEVYDVAGNSTCSRTLNVPLRTTPETVKDLEVGEYVYYIDGKGEQRKCIVLYDMAYNEKNGTDYGVQIMTTDSVENVVIGYNDNTVEGDSNGERAVNSYNYAIKMLNDKAQQYLNNEFAVQARSVGSVPDDPLSEGELGERLIDQSNVNHHVDFGYMRTGDDNYYYDFSELQRISKLSTTEYLPISCWFASRVKRNDSYDDFWLRSCDFRRRDGEYKCFLNDATIDNTIVFFGRVTGVGGVSVSDNLVVCIRLLLDTRVSGGDGSYSNPFILEKP